MDNNIKLTNYVTDMDNKKPRLGIFDTFKTKRQSLTGEAQRQRSIIICLATQNNPAQRTRTAIAQKIAEENGALWKNIYSGIFRDLDEILIPLGMVEEAGRLPLRRGPKALQEKGIPYYSLTEQGLLVALSLDEIIGREKMLDRFLATSGADVDFKEQITALAKFSPRFTYSLFKNYVRAYCEGNVSLLPLEKDSFIKVSEEMIMIQREFLESYSSMPKTEREKMLEFLSNAA
jgi:hypothetical protein